MNPKSANYISIALEGILPILGYFLWDWNVYFVIVFYLFDFILQQVLFSLKVHKTILKPGYYNGTDAGLSSIFRKTLVKQILFGLLVLAVLLITSNQIGTSTIKNFSIMSESSSFFWYREMGIPQGFILIPLLILAGFAMYKMKFLLPRLYLKYDYEKMTRQHISSMLLLLAISGLFLGISYFVELPQYVYVISFAVLKFLFDLLIKDKLYR
jgi:hypothetical protein